MTEPSRTIFEKFQVRKTKKQKAAFREFLCKELEKAGYRPRVEEVSNLFKCHNVVVGDPEKAEVLYTAHYDTCAVLPFPNFITPRNMAVYLLFNVLIVIGIFAAVFVVTFLLSLAMSFLLGEVYTWIITLISNALCIFMCVWILGGGKANKHTANDNTSGVLTLVEIALALPKEDREKVCFVFFDFEESGMLGSSAFAKKHKTVKKNTLNINFDCVSDGDFIQFFPSRGLKKEGETLRRLEAVFAGRGKKKVEVVRGFGFYPSDNKCFSRGAGVCALHRKPVLGYYMSRIHTGRDTVLEEENIALLRDGAVRLVGGSAAGR